MGIMGSDIVAVGCIVTGGVLGGLGWSALDARSTVDSETRTCSGVVVTAMSAPDVVVRIGDGDAIVVGPRGSVAAETRLNCAEVSVTEAELRDRARRDRVQILDLRREFGGVEARRLEARRSILEARERAALARMRRLEGSEGRADKGPEVR